VDDNQQRHESKKHKKPLLCPYCGAQALLRKGSFLLEQVNEKHLYVCVRYPECDTYVSAHEGNKKPLGVLANGTLRRKRILAQQETDRLWKGRTPVFTRKQANNWLADKLSITSHLHLDSAGEGICNLVIKEARLLCKKTLQPH
jgi:ssDNA-binding Zn-finger/Zn-ribbon topoisomerase 1